MATKKKEDAVEDILKYSKDQFMATKKYTGQRDLLSFLLDENTMYSFDEVDKVIEKFLESEAK